MEKPNKLADLKLVAKYYPVSNYSYPRSDRLQYPQRPHGTGRSSVGSDCSVPGMIHDCESDVSAEEDYQYHISGAELWDSFWQANSHAGDGAAVGKRANYPALIPSPAPRRHKQHPSNAQERSWAGDASPPGKTEDEDETAWPLPESPVRPRTPKPASYSLFPAPQKTPARPVLPPRTSSLSPSRSPPAHRPQRSSNLSLPSLPHHRPGPLDLPQPYSAPARSAPSTPPLGSAFPVLTPPRAREALLDTSRPTTAHALHAKTVALAQETVAVRPTTPARGRAASSATLTTAAMRWGADPAAASTQPPRPFTHSNLSGSFFASATGTALFARSAAPGPDRAPSPPLSPRSRPARPRSPSPPRVSVFEDSSDSDRDGGGFFALRRRRGSRRPTKGSSAASDAAAREALAGETDLGRAARGDSVSDEPKDREARPPRLRRQQSDVLLRMLGRWSH